MRRKQSPLINVHNFQARETPEPIFDLSECYLKEVPSGVFVLCRVLRKEVLLLHCNGLTSLKGGGLCSDLSLIRVLDLRQNRIKKLPDEIGLLQEIRVDLIKSSPH